MSQYPGSQVFDTDQNWKLICSSIKEALRMARIKSADIGAISASSMREGMVLYDNKGHEIWACPNVDARAGKEAAEMVEEGLGEKIYSVGGDWLSIISPPRFRWINRHMPKVYDEIAHMTMLSDWIVYKLTNMFVTDPSIGSSSGIFDLSKRCWSDEIIETCGLPEDIFPPVYETGTLIGEVTKEAAQETGLKEGTSVVIGGADTQLGLVGIGAINPLGMATIGGSFWQQTAITDKPVIDPEIRLRTLCHAVPNEWMIEGVGFYSGLAMRWFRDAFCDLEKRESGERGLDPYFIMEQEAQKVPPGSNGVFAIFSNIMNAKRWIQASPMFVQFDITSPQESGRKECIRAIQESATYVAFSHLKIIEALLNHSPKEIVFAGGAAKGFLWPQILCDVLGVRVRIPMIKESTSLGAAICASIALGKYKNMSEAVKQMVKYEQTYSPEIENHDIYMQSYEKWKEIYAHSLRIVEEKLARPMWSPPGL
jgi:autoinducer 2 (AI-2) kinase